MGNVLTKTDGSGTATYGYDDDNRVTASPIPTRRLVTPNPRVTYGYDDDGNRNQMTDGTGTTSYDYDTLERLDSVTTEMAMLSPTATTPTRTSRACPIRTADPQPARTPRPAPAL